MNIYVVSRTDDIGWDEWDAVVVCAKSEADARIIHPNSWAESADEWSDARGWVADPSSEHLSVRLLGPSTEGEERGVVLASFNAG